MPGRKGSKQGYRYGFNGKEKDDELKGEGNSYDFGDRNIYDPRISRFFSIDPDRAKYPDISPYSYAANNPVFLIDLDGRGPIIPKEWWQGNPQLAFFAGMADEAWDTGKSTWELTKELFWLKTDVKEWDKRYGDERKEQYKAIINIFTNQDAQNKLIVTLYEQTGIYINTLAGVNGQDKAEYEKGKLAFQGLTAVIGLSEINAFVKSGSFTDDALKLIAKSKKFKPCGCFTAGTQVYTVEGYKNIEDIKIGDKVWSYDDKTEGLELKEVTDTFTREFTQIYKIYFGNEILEATHEHPFFIGGKWLKVDELKIGDSLSLYDGTTTLITRIELIHGNFIVYNFTVNEFHTYYVSKSNVLVHNGNPCKFSSITKYFKANKFGNTLDKISNKTNFKQGKDAIYKIIGKTENPNLSKGDYFHLDSWHGDHLEVYDKMGNPKAVLNLDGTLNIDKTKSALDNHKPINVN